MGRRGPAHKGKPQSINGVDVCETTTITVFTRPEKPYAN
jgi:hypothetical protein